jgi:hypothetical protein
MLIDAVLACAAVGFLAVFWLTPIGVPTLTRIGGGRTSPDLRFGYGGEETYRLLDAYGAKGVAHWRRLLLIDMIFPAVYAALFVVLAGQWAGWVGAGPVWRAVAVGCPLLAGASDYAENLLLLRVLGALPRRTPAAVAAASLFTRAKFASCAMTLAVPLLHWGATRMGVPG